MSGVLVNPPCEDETGLISVLDLDLKGDNALGMVLQSSYLWQHQPLEDMYTFTLKGRDSKVIVMRQSKSQFPSRTEEELRIFLAANCRQAHCSCIPAKIRCHGAAL